MSGESVQKNDIEKGSSPRWMIIYGDMMTLLLVFFVLFYSYSTISTTKFKKALESLQKSLRILPEQEGVMLEPTPQESEVKQMEKILEEMKGFVEEKGLKGSIRMQYDERRLKITMENPALFDLGMAGLKPTAVPILDKVADIIKKTSTKIIVEGHTCDLPIHTERFPSNWELSTARATQVVRYFIKKCGLPAERLSASGYGEYQPVSPNDSEAHRSLNRRIEVILVSIYSNQE